MKKTISITMGAATLLMPCVALADDGPSTTELKVIADTIWVRVTGFLVFWMNAGFALVESRFCRQKNAANILAKNFIVFAVTTIIYYLVGFGIMFGKGNDYIGMS